MTEPGLCSHCKGADAIDKQVTCTVLEGGPCSICREKEAIQDQIEQLEEEITKMRAKQHALAVKTASTVSKLFQNVPEHSSMLWTFVPDSCHFPSFFDDSCHCSSFFDDSCHCSSFFDDSCHCYCSLMTAVILIVLVLIVLQIHI